MKYRCKEELYFDSYDYNGNLVSENDFCVDKESVWEFAGHNTLIGSDLRLEKDDEWIEMSQETLNKYFEKI